LTSNNLWCLHDIHGDFLHVAVMRTQVMQWLIILQIDVRTDSIQYWRQTNDETICGPLWPVNSRSFQCRINRTEKCDVSTSSTGCFWSTLKLYFHYQGTNESAPIITPRQLAPVTTHGATYWSEVVAMNKQSEALPDRALFCIDTFNLLFSTSSDEPKYTSSGSNRLYITRETLIPLRFFFLCDQHLRRFNLKFRQFIRCINWDRQVPLLRWQRQAWWTV